MSEHPVRFTPKQVASYHLHDWKLFLLLFAPARYVTIYAFNFVYASFCCFNFCRCTHDLSRGEYVVTQLPQTIRRARDRDPHIQLSASLRLEPSRAASTHALALSLNFPSLIAILDIPTMPSFTPRFQLDA